MNLVLALSMLIPVLHVAHLTGLRNTLAALIAVWALVVLVRQRAFPPLAVPASLWLALCLTSAWWSIGAEPTLKSVVTDVAMPFGAFYGAYTTSRRPKALSFFAISLAGSMAVLAILTLGELATRLVVGSASDSTSPLAYYYPGPGVSSTLAVYSVPLTLLLIRDGDRRYRGLAYGVLGLAILTGLASLNRMFWLALVVALTVFAIWQWPLLSSKQRRAVALAIGANVAAAALVMAYVYGVRGPDDDRRLQALREWSAIAEAAPWLGHGFGKEVVQAASDGRLSAQLARKDRNLYSHAHNLFVNIVVQVGLVGLAMFCLLLWALGTHAYRARDPARLSAGAALVALIATMATKNMTDDFMGHAVIVAFWLYAGFLLGRLRPAA
jgi:O-antigen ligase